MEEQPKKHRCPECEAVYTNCTHLNRHIRGKHQQKKPHICHQCGKSFARSDVLQEHIKMHDTQRPLKRNADSDGDPATQHKQRKTSFAQRHQEEAEMTDLKESGVLEEEIVKLYEENWEAIKTHQYEGNNQTMYNLRWSRPNHTPDWEETLMPIFHAQNKHFKINLSHSFILQHRESQKVRFFHASQNNARVFDHPRIINNQKDFYYFLSDLQETDIVEHAKQHRPDSKWGVHSVTSTSFYINPLHDFPIGCCSSALPDFISTNPAFYALEKDKKITLSTQTTCVFFFAASRFTMEPLFTACRLLQKSFLASGSQVNLYQRLKASL